MRMVKQTLPTKIMTGLAMLMVLPLLAATSQGVGAVSLAVIQQQIAKLEKRISGHRGTLYDIRDRRDTLENRIAIYNAQIADIDAKLELTDLKIKSLEKKIIIKGRELDEQKALLAENLRSLYKSGELSTLEILASSDSYSDYINQQEYLERIKVGIQESADKVEALKEELEDQRDQQKILRNEQANQRREVAAQKAEKDALLAQTAGEESRYQSIVSRDKKSLEAAYSELNAELARRAISSGNTYFGTGSYPFATACMNPYPAPWGESKCWYFPYVDAGGYPYRQCTSYVYWRRGNLGNAVPGYWGNASSWPSSAASAGYKVDYTPTKGAIGVIPGGFGHVFVVENVINGSQVTASQYNDPGQNGGQWGMYSVVTYNTAGLQFIHDLK